MPGHFPESRWRGPVMTEPHYAADDEIVVIGEEKGETWTVQPLPALPASLAH